MGQAFKRLERVLDLEASQNYQDKAVIGGMRQFATFWVGKAREEAVDEAELALVEQVAESLQGYSRLPGREARQAAVKDIVAKIQAKPEPEVPVEPTVRESKPTPIPAAKEKTAPKLIPEPSPAPQSLPVIQEEDLEVVAVSPDPEGLLQPVTTLRGVGKKTGQQFSALGAENILQLMHIYPRRYDDYTLLKPINRLEVGETVTVIGTVWETRSRRTRNVLLIQSVISDGTGSIEATWFNQPWLVNNLQAGMQIVLSGKVDQYLGRPILESPEWEPLQMEPLKTRRIVPVYPLTKDLAAHKIREVMKRTTNQWAPRVPDYLPDNLRKKNNLYPLTLALQQIHFPETQEALHQARRRLTFDELLSLQLGMLLLRQERQSLTGVKIPVDPVALTEFIEGLPFELTHAQQRIIADLATDMAKPVPMNRLLQGDVGSGKTVIAAAAIVLTVSAGWQAALMAPTEILAEQHYRSLQGMLSFTDTEVALLTGSTSASEKERIYAGLANGEIKIVIGTHALIQAGLEFKKLGLAIVDEQHRFGVEQRKILRDKGNGSGSDEREIPLSEDFGPNDEEHKALRGEDIGPVSKETGSSPHLLVMSATPIPRTLALSIYGDLDLSILDEMPPGRQEIMTRWLRPSERERAYSFVRAQIEKGRQAFIICPLVEESDKIEAKAAVEEYERLKEHIFPDLKLGLLHGRMPAAEKDASMTTFIEGQTDILVATSVVEVGIDVPNSTIMLIEGANRFGLAQLHQFRGRVGRSTHESYCLLLADEVSSEAEERLTALEQTNDGFQLAEKDLELRGPGEFLGQRQSGLPELKLASLMDMEMVELARSEAQDLIKRDPRLEDEGNRLLRKQVEGYWDQAGDIS